jgi:predicted ATPase/Flp pilus assembly protein TadD
MIGREADLRRLSQALEGAAIVTLVGPPGAGKTRLAHAVLEARHDRKRGVFVDLSMALSSTDVMRSIASTLEVPLGSAQSGDDRASAEAWLDQVLRASKVARSASLVVLDNAEQVVREVAWVAARWSRAGQNTLLVTSRESLRIAGEVVIELAPLALPEASDAPSDVFANPAVSLVLARAPSFTPTPEDAATLVTLVRKLDGIPLALELAASWIGLLGLEGVASRLSSDASTDALDLLAHGRRDVNERQATLRHAIDWSTQWLSPTEALLFAGLSMFRGSFAPEDAVAARPLEMTEGEALDALRSLAEKSLLARTEGGPRLRMLEAIRAYASERVRDEGAEERLAAHFAQRVSKALESIGTRRARAALAWLRAELENLLGVHDALAICHPEQDDLRARLLLGVDAIVQRIGPGGLHQARLDAVLALPLSPVLEVPLRLARARLHRDAGQMPEGEEELERAIACSDETTRARVRADLGEALLARGALDEAEATLKTALADSKRTQDRLGEQKAQSKLGLVFHARGRLDEAQRCYEESLDLAGRCASPPLEAAAHRDLGNVLSQRGLFERARAHYAEALARSPHDDLRLEGVVRGNLGIIALDEGDLELAASSLKRAHVCFRRIGDRTYEAHLLVYAGITEFELGKPHEAGELYQQAIETLAEVGDARMEGIARAACAVARAALGERGAAENDLAVASRRLASIEDASLLALLGVSRAHVALLSAPLGDDLAARREAERALTEAEAHAAHSDDLRFARRALLRAMPSERFVFHPQGFIAPDGKHINLARRLTLARLLDVLVARRLDAPGVPLTLEALMEAGWPGERVLPIAALNRVRVAVTALRNMGLRRVLIFREGGHLLDPEVPIHREMSS